MVTWNNEHLTRSWKKTHVKFLGKRVEVTLDENGPVVVRGILLGFGDDGEFEVADATGVVHYCWPMLHVREVSNEDED
jgi:hypothetical protein